MDEDDDAILRLGEGRKGRKGTSDRTTTGGQQGVEGVREEPEDRKAATRRSARKTQTRERQAVNLVEKDRQGQTLSLSSRSLTLVVRTAKIPAAGVPTLG